MKATVVSLVPFEIHEIKPGLFPGEFHIPAAKDDDFEILVVGESKYPIYVRDGQGVTVREREEEIARSICQDYISGALAKTDDAFPGIFWVSGEHTKDSIKKNFASKLAEYRDIQNRWFKLLVTIADDDWQRTRQHKVISDTQRFAAKALKLEREWISVVSADRKFCPACGIELKSAAAICLNCKAVLDPEAAKKFTFAGVK